MGSPAPKESNIKWIIGFVVVPLLAVYLARSTNVIVNFENVLRVSSTPVIMPTTIATNAPVSSTATAVVVSVDTPTAVIATNTPIPPTATLVQPTRFNRHLTR